MNLDSSQTVALEPSTTVTLSTSTTSTTVDTLTSGDIAGIVIGVILGVAILTVLAYYTYKRRQAAGRRNSDYQLQKRGLIQEDHLKEPAQHRV